MGSIWQQAPWVKGALVTNRPRVRKVMFISGPFGWTYLSKHLLYRFASCLQRFVNDPSQLAIEQQEIWLGAAPHKRHVFPT